MKLENNIGWCDVTTNPGIGCRGCELGDDCYAKFDTPARVLRAGKWPGRVGQPTETFGPGRTFVPTKSGLEKLRTWNNLCICDACHKTYPASMLIEPNTHCTNEDGDYCGTFRRIRAFCDSNSDWMDWPIEILAAALEEIRNAPNVDVILLTKWPWLFKERMESVIQLIETREFNFRGPPLRDWVGLWMNGHPPAQVVTLTSVLGNANDEKRIRGILAMPSACRGLSCEPLWAMPGLMLDHELGAYEPGNDSPLRRVRASAFKWIIFGCDSSKHHKGWESYETNVRFSIEQCRAAGVAVYHKQMPINGRVSLDMNEWPEDLRVREFYGDSRQPTAIS